MSTTDKRFLHDETGKLSMGRALLLSWTVLSFAVIIADSINAVFGDGEGQIPNQVYIFLGAVLPILILWVAAPRAMAKLAPQMSGIVGSVTGALAKLGQSTGGPSPGYERPSDETLDSDPRRARMEEDEP